MALRTSHAAVVVGSGPAGAACARALAERGLTPLVVDAGRQLEPERQAALVDATRGGGIDPAFVEELERAFPVDVDRLPLKPAFGSLFPYAADEPSLLLRRNGVGVVPSLALGGLSNVWGAAILPYREPDLRGWPIRLADLAPYYRSTFGFMPLAGEHDELEELYPLYGEPEALAPTLQIAAVLERLRRANKELRAAGIVAGRARLAVGAGRSALALPCDYTGLCMYGCPRGSIYNAAETVKRLLKEGRVTYRPAVVAERLEEEHDKVKISLRPLDGRPVETILAERVFVACGVIGSTRLVLESLEAYDRPVPLLESAYFTFPLVSRRRAARVGQGLAGNTLAQVFVELHDPTNGSAAGAHLQIYGYNNLMLRALAARSHLPVALAERLLQPLLGRLFYGQGYLHSDNSPRMAAELVRENGRSMFVLSSGEREGTPEKIAAVLRRLRSVASLTGLEPFAPMLQTWEQGKGFHVGGSLPMCGRPEEHQSDLLGRPTGFRRVHVVDASVLPSVPATTITLSVMANAQRIATEHDRD
jgi:choline dehydrogenase-like flavoprotein